MTAAEDRTPTGDRARDARLDNLIERTERAAEGCPDCEVGEPHVCPNLPTGDRAEVGLRLTEDEREALRRCPDCGHDWSGHNDDPSLAPWIKCAGKRGLGSVTGCQCEMTRVAAVERILADRLVARPSAEVGLREAADRVNDYLAATLHLSERDGHFDVGHDDDVPLWSDDLALLAAHPAPGANTEEVERPIHFGYLPECPDGQECPRPGCIDAHVPTPPTASDHTGSGQDDEREIEAVLHAHDTCRAEWLGSHQWTFVCGITVTCHDGENAARRRHVAVALYTAGYDGLSVELRDRQLGNYADSMDANPGNTYPEEFRRGFRHALRMLAAVESNEPPREGVARPAVREAASEALRRRPAVPPVWETWHLDEPDVKAECQFDGEAAMTDRIPTETLRMLLERSGFTKVAVHPEPEQTAPEESP